MRRLSLVALLLLPALETIAGESGMFLCRSPVVANDFWNALLAAQQTGVSVNKEIATGIAQKNDCPFVASNKLKPIDFVAGQLAITDGKIKGWAAPQLYILYANGPDND
jgi:hypothetical protein